jgi:glutathione S-transferase
MIELVQFPWSPFCIVQRRILEFSGVPFKIVNIPSTDRSLVWRLTKQRYYGVPIVKDGRNVVFEVCETSQVIAKYLDAKLKLDLFPRKFDGVQSILWVHIEDAIEGVCFKLNDIHWRTMVPKPEQVAFLRHKERKFGRGCIDQWRARREDLLRELEERLVPYEEMVMHQRFLLGDKPLFVDFDLYGMLANFLFSGLYRLPAAHNHLRSWHRRMASLTLSR